jgi:dihydropteroate synthase
MKLLAKGVCLDLTEPRIMGVLNVTPDSFSDGGSFVALRHAIDHALFMEDAGATIIDIGGESTRPGAAPVSTEQELARVIPVIQALKGRVSSWLSVDTSNPEVISVAAAEGVHIINDVRALRRPGALQAAAATSCAICLMHMQGEPGTMQNQPSYQDVMEEVVFFLHQRVADCDTAGIERERIMVDPGFGFGKTLQHNLALLNRLTELQILNHAVLVGMSRKSMLGELLGRKVDQRLAGSLALALLAVQRGAHVIRAHDVMETADVIRVLRQVN